MDNQMMNGGKTCSCAHHSWLGIAVVVFGALFLLEALGVLTAALVAVVWPILVIVGGGIMLMGEKCKCCAG